MSRYALHSFRIKTPAATAAYTRSNCMIISISNMQLVDINKLGKASVGQLWKHRIWVGILEHHWSPR